MHPSSLCSCFPPPSMFPGKDSPLGLRPLNCPAPTSPCWLLG